MDVSKRHQDQLDRIKDNIQNSYENFRPNYERFHDFRRFVFNTTLDENEKGLALASGKPSLEFNIQESYISRLRGEFSKQEPSIYVMAGDEANIEEPVIDVVQGHIKSILDDANKNGFEYNIYTDTLSGGFSVGKVWTEYANENSFNQVIKIGRTFDPTMCGFDPLARLPTKSDGQFCYEIYPKTKEEFEHEYPKADISSFSFTRDFDSFAWSYQTDKQKVLLVCDYYERKRKRTRIVQLSNRQVMTKDAYKSLLERWQLEGRFEQPPMIVRERTSDFTYICRYRLVENEILEYKETDFKMLPLVFVDGNSIQIQPSRNAGVTQMTRPYVYHTRDTQRLKNVAGQTLAAEISNIGPATLKIAKESIPQEKSYQEGITEPQSGKPIVYNAFKDNDPNQPVPPPQEVMRAPIPQEVPSTFAMCDQLTQVILGSYDAALGINNNQLSGVAIVEGATQSNATAMPYIVGFLQAINQIAEIIIDLIPKYYVTPRTIPVIGKDGKRIYQRINDKVDDKSINLTYTPNALNVKVEAGVNFQIQKNRDMQMILELMKASPAFNAFMNEEGLPELLDNFEVHNIAILREKAAKWMEKMKQMQAQQQQAQANQPNPIQLKMQLDQQKLQQEAQEAQANLQIQAAKVGVDKQNADANTLKVMAQIGESRDEREVQRAKAQAEEVRASVDLAMKEIDMQHKHAKETVELHQKIQKDLNNHDENNRQAPQSLT